jgi:hypothetical protein
MSSGRSTSTVLPSRKASYSFYYWLRRASSYGSTPICILSISLLVLSCDYRVSLLLEDGRRWSFEAIATSWLLIVPSAVYYKKEYAMMGYSQSRWNGWNMGRSMRVCCEEIDSVNYHI